jgi:hypothetical protein
VTRLCAIFIAVFTLSVAAVARADDATDKVVFKKKTLIDFSDVTIEGDLRKPDGAYYGSRKRTRFGSLIKVREHFVEEVKASVDSL